MPTWVPGLAWAEKGPEPVIKRAMKAKPPARAIARRTIIGLVVPYFLPGVTLFGIYRITFHYIGIYAFYLFLS